MGSHLERAAGSCAVLLENQRHIFPSPVIHLLTLFLLLFQISGKIQKICDLFRCKVLQCQKVASF